MPRVLMEPEARSTNWVPATSFLVASSLSRAVFASFASLCVEHQSAIALSNFSRWTFRSFKNWFQKKPAPAKDCGPVWGALSGEQCTEITRGVVSGSRGLAWSRVWTKKGIARALVEGRPLLIKLGCIARWCLGKSFLARPSSGPTEAFRQAFQNPVFNKQPQMCEGDALCRPLRRAGLSLSFRLIRIELPVSACWSVSNRSAAFTCLAR